MADDANPQWVDHCIVSSCDAFERVLRHRAAAHRFGDGFLSEAIVGTLDRLGVRVDLTLEPGVNGRVTHRNEVHTAVATDCGQAPRTPYRPARDDFRTASGTNARRISLLPLSTCQVPWYLQVPRRLYHRVRPAADGMNAAEPLRAVVAVHPGLRPYLFRRLIDRLLGSSATTHLALIVRSSDGTWPEQLQRIRSNMCALASHPLARRFRFVGPEAAVEMLQDGRA